MAVLWRRGTRLFTVASAALVLVAAAHTSGMLSTADDPAGVAVLEAMRGYRFDVVPGMSFSFLDVLMGLGLTMSVLLVGVAVQNLVTVHVTGGAPRVVRALTALNLVFIGGLVVLYAYYRIPPPLVSFVLVEALFAGAWIESPSAGGRAADGPEADVR